MIQHQYIERSSGMAVNERLFGDRMVGLLYSRVREQNSYLFSILTSRRASDLLAGVNFDIPLRNGRRFAERNGIDLTGCLDPPESLTTARKIFERRIRYEECRPMPEMVDAVVSPADARVVPGSFSSDSLLFLKEKFFCFEELLGEHSEEWQYAFRGGDFMIFRLTPDKYHYNHTPVAGRVVDFYSIEGGYHSCNPSAVVSMVTPCSKNRRVVTVIDTDVEEGTGAGLVAMVEVVALMIGDIVQAYSDEGYEAPRSMEKGMFLRKGQPKSLFRPGSSTDILIFQPGRIRIAEDLAANACRADVSSRFSHGFGKNVVETDVRVRSMVATALPKGDAR